MQDNIPVTLIADNIAAPFMRLGEVDAIVVGCHRVAANGEVAGKTWAPPDVRVANPAFDVTPARLVTALITEKGVVYAPTGARLRALMRDAS